MTPDYQGYLEKVLDYHEQESSIPHIKKYELRKGDSIFEIEKYLKELHHYERQYHIFVKEITCLLQELYSSERLHRQL